jgi:hypothetical protein
MVLMFLQSNAQMDSTRYKPSYYLYYGFGWGGQKVARNGGAVVQISSRSSLALALCGTRKEKTDNVPGLIETSPVEQIISASYALMYGRISKRDWGHFIVMAGPSFVEVTKYEEPDPLFPGNYSGSDESSVGLTTQFTVMPAKKFVGLGANFFLNVNGAFTHAGVTLNLAIGRVNYANRFPPSP